MSVISSDLLKRSNNMCEISSSIENLTVLTLPPYSETHLDHSIVITEKLKSQFENPELIIETDWHGLSDSMWNENIPVQVLSYIMLGRLGKTDLQEMMYFDEEIIKWIEKANALEQKVIHKDSNGAVLQNGDSVVLVKDLDVKGANFVAKRGTAVHNIKLVWDNADQIEGRVENQHIVILTQYTKKTK